MKDYKVSELIKKVRTGDDAAFSELLDRYMPLMRKAITSFKTSHFGADEILCEASVAFYKAVMSYDLARDEITFGLYARICVYRRLSDITNSNVAREEAISDVDVCSIAINCGIEASLVSKEQVAITLKKVRTILTDYEYEVFLLVLEGYTTAQIAEKLGKDAKSIDNAKFRCTRRIREHSELFSDI